MNVEAESERSLLLELGKAIAADRTPGRPFDPEELIHLAKTFLKSKRQEIAQVTCRSYMVRFLFENKRLTEAAALMGDLLLQKYDRLPCLAISRLIIMQGLNDYCEAIWES